MDDRRRDLRRPAEHLRVRVRFADRKQFEQCWLKDISQGGIFLRTQAPTPLETPVEVVLTLPDATELTLHGMVVHRVSPEEVRPGHPAGLGVAFTDLSAELRATLAAVVGATDASPLPPPAPEADGPARDGSQAGARPARAAPPFVPPPAGRATSTFPRLEDAEPAPPAATPPPAALPHPVLPRLDVGATASPPAAPAHRVPVMPKLDLDGAPAPAPAAARAPVVRWMDEEAGPAARAPAAVCAPVAPRLDESDANLPVLTPLRPSAADEDAPPKRASGSRLPLSTPPPPATPAPAIVPPPPATPAPAIVPPPPAARAATPAPAAPPRAPASRRAPTPAGVRVALDTSRRLLWRLADATRLAARSYYDVLGVSRSASPIEIQAACEAIRRAFEPERPPAGAEDAVTEVAAVIRLVDAIEACLTNAAARTAYDRGLATRR
jgi:uncharacterized protein (TIGR02266 family)